MVKPISGQTQHFKATVVLGKLIHGHIDFIPVCFRKWFLIYPCQKIYNFLAAFKNITQSAGAGTYKAMLTQVTLE